MQAKNLAKAAMRACESKDVIVLASLPANDFSCRVSSRSPPATKKVHTPLRDDWISR